MNDLLREVGIISRSLESLSNIEFKEFGLSKGQYLYVVRICEHPGIIQDQLADLVKTDRTTAHRSVAKLVEQGFVEKQNDESNKKIKRLFPLQRAIDIYPILLREEKHSNTQALAGLSAEEATQFYQLLQKVRANVEQDWEWVKKGNKRDY